MSVPQIIEQQCSGEAYQPSVQDVARAYALGYLMHFQLDSMVHPLVFSQTYAYCDAGVPGLDRKSHSEVHVEIECELDELVLTVKRGQTISTFDPSTETLQASDRVLNIVGAMYEFALAISHAETLPQNCFRLSVKAYRQTLRWLYSVTGVKRELIGRFETLFRQHSYLRAMIHKNIKLTESIFDNHEHNAWVDPWDKHQRNESFWDLYNSAIKQGYEHVLLLSEAIDKNCEQSFNIEPDKSRERVRDLFSATLAITENINFYGCNESVADPRTGKPKA